MLTVREHRELVEVFGKPPDSLYSPSRKAGPIEPRGGSREVDKAVLDDRGLRVHAHRLLVGRLVLRLRCAFWVQGPRELKDGAAGHIRCRPQSSPGAHR